jgi:hypothetical protein
LDLEEVSTLVATRGEKMEKPSGAFGGVGTALTTTGEAAPWELSSLRVRDTSAMLISSRPYGAGEVTTEEASLSSAMRMSSPLKANLKER